MLEKLQNLELEGPIVVLNDFFLDRIISISDIGVFYSQILEKSKLGGSIRGISQKDIKGGNATNVAYSLARLGFPVSLITVADKIGSALLKETFSEFANSTLFIHDGKPGITTSFEFRKSNDIVNIMVSDIGDNAHFGPEKLGQNELQSLKNSSAVIVTNWASNENGTELANFAFENSVSSLHFLDPADIQTRSEEFLHAMDWIASKLNSLCINENEFGTLLQQCNLGKASTIEDIKNSVRELSSKLLIPIDLHTSLGAFWSDGKRVDFTKSFPIDPVHVTGAGDVWDAANIIGYLANLDSLDRLTFANGAAALYLTSPNTTPPTLDQVLSFVSK